MAGVNKAIIVGNQGIKHPAIIGIDKKICSAMPFFCFSKNLIFHGERFVLIYVRF